jgi:hypothetical protein
MNGPSHPQPGEVWCTPQGRRIYVSQVQGEAVSGNATAPAFTSTAALTTGDEFAHYEGHISDFAAYRLAGYH